MVQGRWTRFHPEELEAVLLPETKEVLARLRAHGGEPGPAFFMFVLTHWRGTQYLDGWGAPAAAVDAFAGAEGGLMGDGAAQRRRDFLQLSGEWPGFADGPERFEKSSGLVRRWYESSCDEEDPPGARVDEDEEFTEMDLAVVEACRRVLRTLDAGGQLWTTAGFGGAQRLLVGVVASGDEESEAERLMRELNPAGLVAWWTA